MIKLTHNQRNINYKLIWQWEELKSRLIFYKRIQYRGMYNFFFFLTVYQNHLIHKFENKNFGTVNIELQLRPRKSQVFVCPSKFGHLKYNNHTIYTIDQSAESQWYFSSTPPTMHHQMITFLAKPFPPMPNTHIKIQKSNNSFQLL